MAGRSGERLGIFLSSMTQKGKIYGPCSGNRKEISEARVTKVDRFMVMFPELTKKS